MLHCSFNNFDHSKISAMTEIQDGLGWKYHLKIPQKHYRNFNELHEPALCNKTYKTITLSKTG